MKTKFLLTACLVAMGMSLQAKNYDYKTVDGDLTKTRIYTLDNGLKVYHAFRHILPFVQVRRTTLPKRQVLLTIWST